MMKTKESILGLTKETEPKKFVTEQAQLSDSLTPISLASTTSTNASPLLGTIQHRLARSSYLKV